MAERKSVNKYYPPDWDPSKGSVNKYVGQHPLRDRAKKLSQGILVIRFEMPYNIWCGGCNIHIGMGVRYNAEKTKVGNYYTTPIYKFRMKCHLCDNYFEIQTDPKNHDYVILEGARRKEQRWDPKENEQIVPEDKATQKKMATDAMFKLEHGSDDVQRGKKAASSLSSLESRRDEWKDDYILNKMARNKFREEKKAIKASKDADEALLSKSSLDIPLIQEKDEDKHLAGLMKYRTVESYEEKQTQKRKEIESRPIFLSNKKSKTDDPGGPSKLNILKKQIQNSSKHSSPFDRMKVNTLGSASALSQNSLGIRRKSLPSYASPVLETGSLDVGPAPVESSNACADEDKTVTSDSQPIKNHGTASSVITENENSIGKDNDIENKQTVEIQNCEITGHHSRLSDISAEGARDSSDCDVSKNASSYDSNSERHNAVSDDRETEKVNGIYKTGLSLVSSYSDSDSNDAIS